MWDLKALVFTGKARFAVIGILLLVLAHCKIVKGTKNVSIYFSIGRF